MEVKLVIDGVELILVEQVPAKTQQFGNAWKDYLKFHEPEPYHSQVKGQPPIIISAFIMKGWKPGPPDDISPAAMVASDMAASERVTPKTRKTKTKRGDVDLSASAAGLKEFQDKNCVGCRYADEAQVGTGEPCCTHMGTPDIDTTGSDVGVCRTRRSSTDS